jgi:hypothetical protein
VPVTAHNIIDAFVSEKPWIHHFKDGKQINLTSHVEVLSHAIPGGNRRTPNLVRNASLRKCRLSRDLRNGKWLASLVKIYYSLPRVGNSISKTQDERVQDPVSTWSGLKGMIYRDWA